MMPEKQRLILVRLSPELTTKARGTRRRFTRRLVENMNDALTTTGEPFNVKSRWNRIFVEAVSDEALDVLTRVPGISSVSKVEATCASDLDTIVETGTRLFADRVKGRTYGVRARRAGSHPFSSGDVQVKLGSALNPGAKVDLDNPEIEVEVEVRDRTTYFFSGRKPGLGGLPLGVEGKAICLLSGGFDSAVAAWLMLKRGVELDYVFCNIAGETYERSVLEVARVLAERWSYGYEPRLHVVDFAEPMNALRAESEPKYWQVLLKRLMYRAAEPIASAFDASAIVTGEAIGQVSSQTLGNLRAIDDATYYPVFRPLLGFDKNEIIDIARRVGTSEISAQVKEYCAIAPGSPVTHASLMRTTEEEAKIDLQTVEQAVSARKVIDLRSFTSADLVERYVFTDHVPEGATLIDVRDEAAWSEWHAPGAVHHDQWALLAKSDELDEDRTYVVYCEHGVQAAHLVEELQRKGLNVLAYRGGTNALKRELRSSAEV